MRQLLVALVLALVAVSPAAASCVQCPSPPCEIQQCPPDEIPMFATILIDGQPAGIGDYVDVGGIGLALTSVAASTEFSGYAEYAFDLSEPGDLWVRMYMKEYAWNGSSWVYNATVDEGYIFVSNTSITEEECRIIGLDECGLGLEYCTINDCSRSKWCPDAYGGGGTCMIVTGDCVDSFIWGCTGCSAKVPGCVNVNLDPIKLAKKYCRTGYRCTVDIQPASGM